MVVAAALAAAIVLVGPEAADAAATSVVVWTGGQLPGQTRTGVLVKPDGTAQLLAPAGPGTAKVKVVKTFTVSPAKLALIRIVAKSVLSGPAVAIADRQDGFYITATVKVGKSTRTLVGVNALPPKLQILMGVVVTAVPPSSSTAAARVALRRPLARVAEYPSPSGCAPGAPPPTRVARELSLKQAAQLGLVKLTSKGGFNGDVMAVDGTFKDVRAPTVVRLDIQLVSDEKGIESKFESSVEKALAGYKLNAGPLKGEPIKFDLNVISRGTAGTKPAACFHQIAITNNPTLRDSVGGLGPGPEQGELNGVDRSAWTHETMHLAGLDDRYDDYFNYGGGKSVKLPENGLEGDALAAALGKLGVKAGNGTLISKARPGYKGNLMADAAAGKLSQADLAFFAQRGQDNLIIHSDAGDLLMSKNGDQNVANAQSFDLMLKRGGPPVHLDGMSAYCADLHRATPKRGVAYDVLGSPAELGDPAFAGLAKVLDVVSRRRADVGSSDSLPRGAQEAVWRVTDDKQANTDEGIAILQEAGISPNPADQKFNAPHYTNPNAGSAATGAVTPGATLGPLDLGTPQARLATPRARLRGARMLVASAPRARLLPESLQVTFAAGAGDRVALSLERFGRGRRFRRVRGLGRQTVNDGVSVLGLVLRGLTPGRYRVRVAASRGQVAFAAFRVVR